MAYYRIYLLNEADCIFEGKGIDCDGDDKAIVAAAHLISGNPAVEIWAGARKVAHLTAEELGKREPQERREAAE